MKKPFFLVVDELLNNDELGGRLDYVMALSKISSRICLSRTKGQDYYDDNRKDYYALYTQDEMCEKIHRSPRKVNDIYRYLDEWGYINRKKIGNHKADKIFLTSHMQNLLPKSAKSASGDQQNVQGSNSERNIIDRSQEMDRSDNSVNAQSENEKDTSPSQIEKGKEASDHKSLLSASNLKDKWSNRLISWIQSVHNKLGLSGNVIKKVLLVSRKRIHQAKHVIDLIKNARTNVAKIHHLSNQNSLTRFEYNKNFDTPLANKIPYVFNYANKKAKNINGRDRYLMKCLKNFCYDAFGLARKSIVKPKMHSEVIQDDDNQVFLSDAMEDNNNDINNNGMPKIPTTPTWKMQQQNNSL